MENNEALVTLTDKVYVPAFRKAAADLGVDLSNDEDLSRALDIAVALSSLKQQGSSSVVKSAHETLMAALGQPVEAEAPAVAEETQPVVDESVKAALAALKA